MSSSQYDDAIERIWDARDLGTWLDGSLFDWFDLNPGIAGIVGGARDIDPTTGEKWAAVNDEGVDVFREPGTNTWRTQGGQFAKGPSDPTVPQVRSVTALNPQGQLIKQDPRGAWHLNGKYTFKP